MYVLSEPKPDVKQQYVKQMQYSLLHDSQTSVQLIKDYKKQHPDLAKRISRAMSQALCIRRSLIKHYSYVKKM